MFKNSLDMKSKTIKKVIETNHLNRRKFLGNSVGIISTAALFPLTCDSEPLIIQSDSIFSNRPNFLGQNYTVAYQRSDNTGRGLDGPDLVKMKDGTIVAVIPFKPNHGNWICHVVQSLDEGKTWTKPIAELPFCSAMLWEYKEILYMFAFPDWGGNLLLLQSKDTGKSWSHAITLFEGSFWNCQTGMAIRDNYLYVALDDFVGKGEKRGPRIIAGDLSADLMNPKSWRISNHVPFPGLPESLMHPQMQEGYPSQRMLEPAILNVNGRLRVLSAVKPPFQATTNLCAVFDVTDDGKNIEINFTQFHPMPGGQVKFCIIYDEVSRLFWASVNYAADGQDQFNLNDPKEGRDGKNYPGAIGGNDRRFLMLQYSLDGLNWFPAGCVARAGRLGHSFMYPSHIIDGDDLLIIARSSIDGENRHDADSATFHRVSNFRKLAMNLKQDID